MATLVKLRGLDRGIAAGDSPTFQPRGFRVRSGHGSQFPAGVKATATGGATTSGIVVTAKYGGTWANGHTVNVSQAGSGTGTVTYTYAANTGVPTFVVTGAATMTALNAVNALNADPVFKQLYTAAPLTTGAGTTLVSPGALATGTNVGTGQPIYVSISNGTYIVDADDRDSVRTLKRNGWRFLSLGAA